MKLQRCTNCIHQKVCSIYEFAKKFNAESMSNHFASFTMSDVCGNYKEEIEE